MEIIFLIVRKLIFSKKEKYIILFSRILKMVYQMPVADDLFLPIDQNHRQHWENENFKYPDEISDGRKKCTQRVHEPKGQTGGHDQKDRINHHFFDCNFVP